MITNVINEASNLCLNGIRENNDNDNDNQDGDEDEDNDNNNNNNNNNNIKLIGNNVIRRDKIETLIEKMGCFSNQKNHKNPTNNTTKKHKINRNPVTHKYSTYHQHDRNENIGGILLKTEEIANIYANNINNVDIMMMKKNKNFYNNQNCVGGHLFNYQMNNDCNDNNNNYSNQNINDNNNGNINNNYNYNYNHFNHSLNNNNNNMNNHNHNNNNNNNHHRIIRTRARSQIEKKAKKYSAPSEELTRLQIREDIRKMRHPETDEIKDILKLIGFQQYINHKTYKSINDDNYYYVNSNNNIRNHNNDHDNDNDNDNDDDDDDDDDVQFIGINTTKPKKKKKKKLDHLSPSNSVFSISSENNNKNDKDIDINDNDEPPQKKQKLNNNNNNNNNKNEESIIKCGKCNKIFTLEVDLLLHKTNDKC